jgi:transposase
MEPTGGYENPLRNAMFEKKLPCKRMHATQIKNYVRSLGQIAKTDKIDATMIAQFAAERMPEADKIPGQRQVELDSLSQTRRQLVSDRQCWKNRLKQTSNKTSLKSIDNIIESLTKEIETLDAKIADLMDKDAAMKERKEILKSMPGIQDVRAAALLSDCPELGELSTSAAGALAGLAPFNHDSRKMRGQPHIYGGRASLRITLFMTAMSIIRMTEDNVFKALYERLLAKGKAKMMALIAVTHKILTVANALLKKNEMWQNNLITN